MTLSEFTKLLRCPETRQKLALAPAGLLERMRAGQADGKLFHASGKPVAAPITAGLVREDGVLLYPLIDDIPMMLKDEAIVLGKI